MSGHDCLLRFYRKVQTKENDADTGTDCQRSLLKSFRLSPPNRALNTPPKTLNTKKNTMIAIISSITFSYSNELYTIIQVHHFQPVLSGFLDGVERTALVSTIMVGNEP